MIEQWEKLKELFDRALNLSGQELENFLSGIDYEDPALCAELKHLIEHHKAAGNFLEADDTIRGGAFIAGQTVSGRYRIVRQLGRGGMGEVYEALDTALNEKIALKTVRQDATVDRAITARLIQELQLARKVTHPNVCRVYDIGRDTADTGEIVFFTMELVHGETLATRIRREGKLNAQVALTIARRIADGIDAAHACGIVHRDLKPANIMLTDHGRVVIMDFGLARGSAPNSSGSVTVKGFVFGTPGYISPEQAAGGQATPASDVYAFGVVIHEMLTGRKPTDNAGTTEASTAGINPVWNNVVRKCLELRPADRFETAAQVIRAFEEALANANLAKLDTGSSKGDSERSRGPLKKTRGWVEASLRTLLSRGATICEYLHIRPGKLGFAISATVVTLVVAYTFMAHFFDPNASLVNPTFLQLTNLSGMELFPSLSPDGKSFVYAGQDSGNWDIYFQRVGGQNAINLTKDSPDDDTEPALSPNGDIIAFRSERLGGGIFVMGATGESVRRITDFGFNPAWSPDGKQLVIATEDITDNPNDRHPGTSALWVLAIAGGQPRRISDGDAVQPHWSPHGYRIAYWAKEKGNRNVWTMRPDGTLPKPVTNEAFLTWNPVWSPDGRYLYFSSDRGGNLNLWRVRIDEKSGDVLGKPQPVTTGGGSAQREHPTLAADGHHIAYVEQTSNQSLQRVAFDAIAEKVLGQTIALGRSLRPIAQADLSPDGQWFAFASGGTQEDIFVVRTDGTGERQLTNDLYRDKVPRWSPDGTRIAFYSNRSGTYEAWTIRPDGSGLQQVSHDGIHSITRAIWSPDGEQMIVSCFEEGPRIIPSQNPGAGPDHIIRRLPAMSRPEDHFDPWSWSPDGKWIAGSRRPGMAADGDAGVAVYSLETDQYEMLSQTGWLPVWLNDSRRILFVSRGKIFIADRVSKVVRELFSMPPGTISEMSQLSRDNRFLHFLLLSREADIWLLTAQ